MAKNENLPGDFKPGTGPVSVKTGLHPLHEAAMRLAEIGLGKSRSKAKTRDLVTMLLSHGARAWRGSQPTVRIHLHVSTDRGRRPIYMRLG